MSARTSCETRHGEPFSVITTPLSPDVWITRTTTKPRVTRPLGNGDHVVEGMKFNMGGWWIVKFRVDAAAGQDSLVFNVKL